MCKKFQGILAPAGKNTQAETADSSIFVLRSTHTFLLPNYACCLCRKLLVVVVVVLDDDGDCFHLHPHTHARTHTIPTIPTRWAKRGVFVSGIPLSSRNG